MCAKFLPPSNHVKDVYDSSSSFIAHEPCQVAEKARNHGESGDAVVLLNDPELIYPALALSLPRSATQLINSVWKPCHVMMYEGKFDFEGEGACACPTALS